MAELSLESLFTPETIADPYPMYRQLRESHPVLELPDANLVIFSRYRDAQTLLRSRQLGHEDDSMLSHEQREEIRANPALANLRQTMLLRNPPDHTRLRSLVVKAFDARRVEAMRPRIRAIADQLVDDFIENGEGDLVRAFTHPLPVIVICDMLGIPETDQAEFVRGTRISGRLIDPSPMTPEELAEANRSTGETRLYFEGLCEERRRQPRDDLITALVHSETEEGRLSKDELTSNIALLFAAGHETTVNLMGNALLALYRNPDQLEKLRHNPALMPGAVEEFLRYDSSVQITGRNAMEDVEICGVELPRGRSVLTLLGAANRDPEVFDDPDVLDIEREKVKPLSFGGGIHLCLGAQLARIEAKEALEVLLDRLDDLELTEIDRPDWKPTITLRGLKSLPARWTAG
jgi:cytochrome P450